MLTKSYSCINLVCVMQVVQVFMFQLNDIRYMDIGNYDIKIAAKDGGQ